MHAPPYQIFNSPSAAKFSRRCCASSLYHPPSQPRPVNQGTGDHLGSCLSRLQPWWHDVLFLTSVIVERTHVLNSAPSALILVAVVES
jgi:hypothetical protein